MRRSLIALFKSLMALLSGLRMTYEKTPATNPKITVIEAAM
jgi:hypothetical protein